MRIQLFEFEDLPWFPDVLRQSMLDYLRYILLLADYYRPAAPMIAEGMRHTGDTHVLDLCAGGGGAIEKIQRQLSLVVGKEVPVVLTDLYPNVQAYELIERRTRGSISYIAESVDATRIGKDLKGFRTIFSAFHHFRPDTARKILEDAVTSRSGIAIFDGGDKNAAVLLGMLLFHPILFFLLTPFFKPFRISRLIFTYLLPLIPLCTIWDGMVSVLRLYSPSDLDALTAGLPGEGYFWRSGKVANRLGAKVTYLVGYPRDSD